MIRISTYYRSKEKETATVCLSDEEYIIVYESELNELGQELTEIETFPGKSLSFVEDVAENWALGIKERELLMLEINQ